jgi:hypothetical protein
MDGVKGNFGISDREQYIGNMLAFDGKHKTQIIHINDKSFVELQQYLYDTLWSKAIQAREKIKEIELGLDNEFIETINEPLQIQKIIHTLLKSATYEILILFSTVHSFHRATNENILELLKDSVERGVNVRLLAPAEDENIKGILGKGMKQRRKQIYIQYIRKPLQSKIITLIIDQTISLSIEINDDTTENFIESFGLATYSNSESNVSSCASIFESLWIQSELDKQNKIKQVYFKVFKGFGLKDETYMRSWQNEDKS